MPGASNAHLEPQFEDKAAEWSPEPQEYTPRKLIFVLDSEWSQVYYEAICRCRCWGTAEDLLSAP